MRKLNLQILISALLVGIALGVVSLSNFGYRVESLVWDQWFGIRYKLMGPQPIDPRLVMVGIDEHTINHFGKPQILWQSELAGLINKIKEGKPSVVGMDIVIHPSTNSMQPDDPLRVRIEDEALQLGLAALDPPPVVLIEVFREDFIFLNQADKNKVFSPHEICLDLLLDENADSEHLAFANLAGDADGVLRRGKLLVRKQNADGKERADNLAFRMLSLGTGQPVELEKVGEEKKVRWNAIEVPFIFDESFLLNFPGPTEDNNQQAHSPERALTFPIYSGEAVLKEDVPATVFKDKIVLIAPTSSSLSDEKVVPGDPQYHGGAIHLTIMNMFLKNQFLSRPVWLWIALPLLLIFTGVQAGKRGKVLPAVALLAAVPLIGYMSFAFLLWWCPVIFPLIAVAVGCGLGYLERLLTIERDRARVRSTFARMVSPQVMNHVLANYRKLKNGERKELTVLFSDINDFTPICEQHSPEEVIHMLSDYFSKMVDVIMKYDGYLKQYVGDEIMVIFGAPDDSTDHATRAVMTALEMRDVLAQAKRDANGKPGFYEVKIGINTGSVVVGKVGPESRWEYAAVGDDVNLGARVMSAAKNLGMDIGVSAASKARFEKEREQGVTEGDKVKWISRGIQSFKGKISQMEVFGIEREE